MTKKKKEHLSCLPIQRTLPIYSSNVINQLSLFFIKIRKEFIRLTS